MARPARNNGHARAAAPAKYDAHHNVLNKAYGAFADLPPQPSDNKPTGAQRTDLLHLFGPLPDFPPPWLLLEDYFEKLSLARKDFPGQTWWPRLMNARGKE